MICFVSKLNITKKTLLLNTESLKRPFNDLFGPFTEYQHRQFLYDANFRVINKAGFNRRFIENL
jgi:hypothetical protein